MSRVTRWFTVVGAALAVTAGMSLAAVGPAVAVSAPSSPLSPAVVTAGSGAFTASWQPPASDGGSPILIYSVTATTAVAGAPTNTCYQIPPVPPAPAPAPPITCTMIGLYNAVPYTFTVVATNALGDSPAASAGSATAVGVAPPPRSLAAVPSNGSADLSWVAPVSNGGGPISAYHVVAIPGGASCDPVLPILTCTISGLTNGQLYTFTATATNPYGVGAASSPATTTPRTVPDAPTSVIATPGNTQATIGWTAPANNGGSAITGYTVTTSPPSAGCTTGGALTCVVPALTNGILYTFSVTATNVAGTGAAGTATTTPRTVPAAPTAVTATPSDTQATIAWAAPNDGGAAITGYTVTSIPASAGCTTGGALTCDVTGLANGTLYTFSVTATNVAGTGPAGTATTTPRTVPAAPTGVNATPGNTQATITWTAPNNGGAAITGYTVTTTPASAGCTTGGALTCDVTGLTNGTLYTFSVTATNVAGTGPAGTAATTPRTIPSVPLDVMAVPDNHQVTVSWQAPLTNGGAAISGYTVTTTPASAGCTTGGALTCTVTGLTNGTPYQFTVTATNVAGASSASAPPVTSTPRTVPGAPTALAAVPGNEEVELTWTAPADNGGAIILGYTVTASPGGAQCQTNGPRTCIVSGLTNGQLYSFTVTAMNVAGTGAPSASASATPVRVPDPPTGVSATRGVGSVTLAWSAPVNQGGSAVTSYAVSGPGTSGCTTIATSCTVGALAAGQNYTFTVIATNAVGDGLASDAVTAAPLTIPTIPRNVQSGRAGNASSVASNLRVSWNAPLSNGGTPIVRYTVIGGGATCSTAGLTCILTGITRLPTMVTVVATNIVGDSASGTVVSPARLATFNIGKRSPATRKFYGSGVVPGQRVRIYSVVNSHLVYLTSTVVNSRLQWSKIVTVPYGYRTWVVKSRQWRSGVRHTNR